MLHIRLWTKFFWVFSVILLPTGIALYTLVFVRFTTTFTIYSCIKGSHVPVNFWKTKEIFKDPCIFGKRHRVWLAHNLVGWVAQRCNTFSSLVGLVWKSCKNDQCLSSKFLQWIKQFELASVKKTFVVETSTPLTGPLSWWFISKAYLEPSQTWLTVFAKIVNRLLVVNYFYKNAPSLISDWVLLFIIASCSYSLIQVSLSNCIFLILMTCTDDFFWKIP